MNSTTLSLFHEPDTTNCTITKTPEKSKLKSITPTQRPKMTSPRKLHFDDIDNYTETGKWNKNWYKITNETITELFPGEDHELIIDLLAITSMHSTLKSNVSQFVKAYYQYKNDLPFEGYTPAVIMHLEYRKNGQPFGGRKVANFARAIKGDDQAVVVDMWMLRAFGIWQDNVTPSKREYDNIEHYIFSTCMKHNMTPVQMQASIWTGIRIQKYGSIETTRYCDVLRSKIKPSLFSNGERRYTKKFIYV